MFLGRFLPHEHRSDATQRVVQTATGMVSLLSVLVLGLLVSTAKNKFDTSNQQVEQFAANLMLVNRELVNCGPEADNTRALLRKYTVAKIAETWAAGSGPKPAFDDPPAWKLLESVQQSLTQLAPHTEAQREEAARASQTAADLAKTTWLQAAEESQHVPHPFVLIMIVWLFVLFLSFGLFAPRNALVVIALLVGALSLAGAVVLVVDMDSPFEGMIVVSADPMQDALGKINAP
jgi:hypothetical protein